MFSLGNISFSGDYYRALDPSPGRLFFQRLKLNSCCICATSELSTPSTVLTISSVLFSLKVFKTAIRYSLSVAVHSQNNCIFIRLFDERASEMTHVLHVVSFLHTSSSKLFTVCRAGSCNKNCCSAKSQARGFTSHCPPGCQED